MIAHVRRLYRGENDWDIIGRSRLWLTISLVAVGVSMLSLAVRGLNFSIEFRGGSLWVAPVADDVGEGDVRGVLTGVPDAVVVFVTEGGQRRVRVSSRVSEADVVDSVRINLSELPGGNLEESIVDSVGPTWGAEISRRAVQGLVIFLVLVAVYISIRFEWRMAVGALAALTHDCIITAGVFSLVGFTVAPESVIAFLTILGYSLYDSVVVYDRIDENTELVSQTARQTYSDTVNYSLNSVLMRSVNTSVSSLIPIGTVLLIGLTTTAAETLTEFALALFVGLLVGTYSSVFVSAPIVAWLKEREPQYRAVRARLEARRSRVVEPAAAAQVGTAASGTGAPSLADGAEEPEEEAAVAGRARARQGGPPPRRRPAGSRPKSGKRKSGGGKRRR